MRRASPITAIALIASTGLHLALFAWFATRPPQVVRKANVPLEVALVFTAPPPPPEAPAQVPAPAPKPPPLNRAPRPSVTQTTTPPPPAAQEQTPSARAEAQDVPRQPLKLLPTLDLSAQVVSGGEIAVKIEPRKEGLHAVEAPEDLVAVITHETIGAIKVKNGLIHPYYSQLGKTLLKKWDAERAVSANGLSGYVEQRIENSRAYQKIWMNHAEEYGRTGNPLGGAAASTPRVAVHTPPSIDPNLAARQALRKQMRQEFRASKKATLRVRQDTLGKLISAELISPSNDAQVDKAALEDVRAAAAQLPPPPPEALGTRTELVSLWQFELVVSITPPVPSITFEFDEALGYVDPRLPLDRRIYKKVKLLSIE